MYGLISKVLFVLFLVWATKAVYTYFLVSQEDAIEEFGGLMWDPFGVPKASRSLFIKNTFAVYWGGGDGQSKLRRHVVTSFITATLLFIQFQKSIRKKSMNVHR